MRYTQISKTAGFTLVEMLVVAPIILLTIATFIGVLIYITGETLIARTSNNLAYNVQDSLDTIERDITLSSAFLSSNMVAIASPQGYDNGSAPFSNSSPSGVMLILNIAATTDAPGQGNRQLIRLNNVDNPCGHPMVDQNQPLTYNIVYFVKDNTLWRRTLMPSNYQTIGCGATPWQLPSCAPDQTGGICRTEDVKLIAGVSSADFTIDYFTSARANNPANDANDYDLSISERQTALNNTNTATITLKATEQIAGKEATYTGTVRVSRIGPLSTETTPVP